MQIVSLLRGRTRVRGDIRVYQENGQDRSSRDRTGLENERTVLEGKRIMKTKKYDQLLQEELRDEGFRQEYDATADDFEVAKEAIKFGRKQT